MLLSGSSGNPTFAQATMTPIPTRKYILWADASDRSPSPELRQEWRPDLSFAQRRGRRFRLQSRLGLWKYPVSQCHNANCMAAGSHSAWPRLVESERPYCDLEETRMADRIQDSNRRRMIRLTVLGLAAPSLGVALTSGVATAADPPRSAKRIRRRRRSSTRRTRRKPRSGRTRARRAPIARCIPERPAPRRVHAPSFRANWFPPRAGAAPGRRKPDGLTLG